MNSKPGSTSSSRSTSIGLFLSRLVEKVDKWPTFVELQLAVIPTSGMGSPRPSPFLQLLYSYAYNNFTSSLASMLIWAFFFIQIQSHLRWGCLHSSENPIELCQECPRVLERGSSLQWLDWLTRYRGFAGLTGPHWQNVSGHFLAKGGVPFASPVAPSLLPPVSFAFPLRSGLPKSCWTSVHIFLLFFDS